MAILGALARGAMGAVKGGAKKIAADKLLNRKKKKPQKSQEEGAEQEKGGALAIRPTTSLVPISIGGGGSIGGDDGGGDSDGKKDTPGAIVLAVSTKVVKVDKLLANSFAIREKTRDDAKKQAKIDQDKKQEKDLEKIKPKEGKFKIPGADKAKSLLERIFNFFSSVIFGWLLVRLVDWIPKLMPILKALGNIVDGIIHWGGVILDALAGIIDFGYKLVDKIESWVKDTYGEEGVEKFKTFMGNLKDLINGFIIWKLIGEKIFKAIVGAIKNVFNAVKFIWRSVSRAIRTIWVKLRRLIGRKARLFLKNVVKRAGGAVKAVGKGILDVGKNVAGRVGGLLSKGGAKLAQTGVGKFAGKAAGVVGKGASVVGKGVAKVGGWATKLFGKAAGIIAPALKTAMPAVKGFAKRIPIFGSLIVGLISLMSGEPLGHALFKTIGAGIGGALGSFIPIPFLGTLLGETFGAFIGDVLYYGIMEGDWKKAGKVLKQHLSGVFKAGKAVWNFVSGGFSRFYEGIPKFKVPDIPEEPPGWIPKWVPMKKRIWDVFRGGIKLLIGPLSLLVGKEIPNLLWLVNPMNTAPLLVKSFFSPGEQESPGGSPPVPSGGGGDKSEGIKKQENKLISANQKGGYDGVMKEIESYTSYDERSSTTISLPDPIGPARQKEVSDDENRAYVLPIGGKGGSDPYEALDFFG